MRVEFQFSALQEVSGGQEVVMRVAVSAGGMQNRSTSRRKLRDPENTIVTVETESDFGASQTRQLKTSDAYFNDAWLSELGEYLGDSA